MLTREETAETVEKLLRRLDWYDENVAEPERSVLFCNELGVDIEVLNLTIDGIIAVYMGVPPEIVRLVSTSTIASMTAALAIGIQLGKRVEREVHGAPAE